MHTAVGGSPLGQQVASSLRCCQTQMEGGRKARGRREEEKGVSSGRDGGEKKARGKETLAGS